MAIYYIDNQNGLDTNDGLSELSPKKDYTKIDVKSGDSVLFKCGTFIRGMLENVYDNKGDIITYGSYGEGEKPTFCGSVDTLSNPDVWCEESQNIWVTDAVCDEVCNFIFDDGASYGTLCWEKEDLSCQGDFYDNCFGTRTHEHTLPCNHRIYMYSCENPAKFYKNIETVTYAKRRLATNGDNLCFENLRFINSGVHGIAAGPSAINLTVKNCDFENIGGCVWGKEQRIRFGNGFECWDIAKNVTVTGCYFYNIYDSGVTHQGSKTGCKPAENMHFDNNIFIKCGMGAYEQRDLLPMSATFNNNICIDAGCGFSKQGEIMPRRSEIWPQPMGHHVFLWRIEKQTPGGSLEIKNNIFSGAEYGASIYSIIEKCAECQIVLADNIYCTPERDTLINRFYGKDFKIFEEYKNAQIETNPISKKIDISQYLKRR